MIRRYRKDVATVSLFPFLAVLICTMGILVVLLVLAVKAADVNATETAESRVEVTAQAENLRSQLQDEQLRVDSLSAIRPEVLQRLSRERQRRSLMESEIRQLRDRLEAARLQFRESQMAAQSETTEVDSENEVDQLKMLIAQTLAQAGDLRETTGDGQKTYSIVPYNGASGSARKPIYIECTREGLTIQPSGIQLTDRDFTMPILPGNPLDAALLAVRQYHRQNSLEADAGQAYPLLIVRPGGESNFALARRAMKSWDDEFGYELVEQEKELGFGEPDAALVRELEAVINESLRKQARLVAVMESRGQSFQKISTARDRNLTHGTANGTANGEGGSSNSSRDLQDDSRHSQAELASAANQFSSQPNNAEMNGESGKTEPDLTYSASEKSAASANSFASNDQSPSSPATKNQPTRSSSFDPGSSKEQGNLNIGQVSSQSVSPVSDSRGENWALPSSTTNAIAYRRPIKVICGANRIVVDPGENSNLNKVSIPIQGSIDESLDSFVQSVWTVIESWGIAGSGGYWKPVLDFNILPGGQVNHERLHILLQNSGLEVE